MYTHGSQPLFQPFYLIRAYISDERDPFHLVLILMSAVMFDILNDTNLTLQELR